MRALISLLTTESQLANSRSVFRFEFSKGETGAVGLCADCVHRPKGVPVGKPQMYRKLADSWLVGKQEVETPHFDSESWMRNVAVCELCVRVLSFGKALF